MKAFPDTIVELLTWRASEPGSAGDGVSARRTWLRFGSSSWTFADALSESEACATGLAGLGVGHGDRVAILLGNAPEHLFVWFGANLLGAIAMPVHSALTPGEIAAALSHTRPRVVVAQSVDVARAALAMTNEHPAVVTPSTLTSTGKGYTRGEVRADDVAVLLTTSGTTGKPKAVMQTHGAYALTAEAFPWWLGLDASDRLLTMLPLSHINAQAYSVMGSLGAGAELALLEKFSASRFWGQVRELGATQFNAVGAIVHILLSSAPRPDDAENPARLCYTALALDEERHRAFERRFGLEMRVGYGLSESTFGTIWPKDEAPRYGTMGRLRQHPRLGNISQARVEREDGSEASVGEVGELLLKSPATMRGYFEDPVSTRAVLDGGWLRTGDLVRRDADGHFSFVARKKEVLRRRGENVAAAEIEAALLAHPLVREAAAIGVPSELGDDEIVAFVALEPEARLDPEELRAFVGARLAAFKVPSRIELRDSLPRTATERIAKHLLR